MHGLIVIDEEHDPTCRQEDRVQYHARDLALVRAKADGAAVIDRLDQQISTGGFPDIELIDLGEEELVEFDTQALLATRTVEQIKATLLAGSQALVFLNRRGFASFLICTDCKAVVECHQCSVSLTLHKRKARTCKG